MKVADILAQKGSTITTIKPSETIEALARLLREKRVGAAVVSGDGRRIDGVITERDLTFGLAVHGGKLHTMAVSALMTKEVITCAPKDDIAFVASMMLSNTIRHIPVAHENRLVGMVSIRDVLKFRLDDLQQQAAHLRTFAAEIGRVPQDRE